MTMPASRPGRRARDARSRAVRPVRRRRVRALTGPAVLACVLGLAGHAAAATITVTGAGPPVAGDGVCGLAEAVANADADAPAVADCVAGTGADRIVFLSGGVHSTVGAPDPAAGQRLEIDGGGRGVILQGDDAHRALTVPEGAVVTLRALTVGGGTAVDCPGVTVYLGCGGAVFNSGSLTLDGVTVTGGDAGPAGFGGGLFNRGSLTVRRSTIRGNRASSGAALADAGTARIENTTISGNSAESGAAVYGAGDTRLTHVTLVGAAPGTAGTPALVAVDAGGVVRAGNTLFAGPDALSCGGAGVLQDAGGDVASSARGCPGTAGDAALGPLTGGSGPAVHVPGAGSAALDAGVEANCLATDERGVGRPQGAACDAGAVEVAVTPPPPPPSDTTPPVVTPSVVGPEGDAGWYVGDVTVRWTIDDPESPAAPGPGCGGTVVRDDTAGRTITCTATSDGGTTTARVMVRRDATPPRIAVETPAPGGVYTLDQPVTLTYGCDDDTAGVAACDGPAAAGSAVDTSFIGPRTFSYTARDAAGNTSGTLANFRVDYPVGGFPGPGRPTRAVAGRTVYVQFDLGGDRGGDVLASEDPATSQRVDCATGETTGTAAAIATGKRTIAYYDTRLHRYVIPWRTDRRWAGTCRRLSVRLLDGTVNAADFRFVRQVPGPAS